MRLVNSSLTVVLLGDWNKLYIQPNWIAENVFGKNKIDIGVFGKGVDISISYRSDNVSIAPSQTKMVFTTIDLNDSSIDSLVLFVNRFLQKAFTPELIAYGINCEFEEYNSSIFAEVLDSISDNKSIIENGYQIYDTTIKRSLRKNDSIINLESKQISDKTIMHFNEHHAKPFKETPSISRDMIIDFISNSKNMILALGYDLEEM